MKIASTFLLALLLGALSVCLIGGALLLWPEWVKDTFNIGPFSTTGIVIISLLLMLAALIIGWVLETVFAKNGEKQGKLDVVASGQQAAASQPEAKHTDADTSRFVAEALVDHLRLRYRRRWKAKVRLLLVQGTDSDIEKVVPGLKGDHWQESDGIVIIYGGLAVSVPDDEFLSVLKAVRPQRPLDGVVQVMNTAALPDTAKQDTLVRVRQKTDTQLGWQLPVWLWLVWEGSWDQDGVGVPPAGALFGPGATTEEVRSTLTSLSSDLQTPGVSALLENSQHHWLLSLSKALRGSLRRSLIPLLTTLMSGPAPYRLRGVMFSPALPGTETVPHARLSPPVWQALENDSLQVHARKIGFHWQKVLRLVLLGLVLLWGAGTLLSLSVNRTQIWLAQDTARVAADTKQPLPERLRNQLALQQTIARLQNREVHGAPWYTRFGLNQDSDTLKMLWPLYARTGSSIQPGIVLPGTVMNDATASTRDFAGGPDEDTPESAVKWVYVAQPEPQSNVEVLSTMPVPVKKWKSFAAGMCTMLVISIVSAWSWHFLHRPDPLQTQLAASLAPFPVPLTSEQLGMLRQQTPLPQDLIAQTQHQLARLDKLPPDWDIAYSRKLIEQVQVLWPEQAKPLVQQWRQQINVSVLPVDKTNGWHEGMTQLQALSDKLNALDGQKGEYITVSELKSQVFGMLTSFRQTVPVEEQLRQLKLLPEDSPQRQQQIQQAEQHLRAQVYMLAQEKHRE
ncbi:VasL domain-containing protein [Enterobacter sp. 214E4]|uniref:VasL domain-containing protein n=1 Tax=Enterobacter sp. 214E4 TaxID=3077759 RepID=UPI0039C324C3